MICMDFYELLLGFYEVVLVSLVSPPYSLDTVYCNEFSTQFTVY